MSKNTAIYTLICFLLMPQIARGFYGNELYEWCTSDESLYRNFCMGYIQGAVDQQDMAMYINGNFYYCHPSITNEQARKVVIKYMDLYPEYLNLGAWQIVAHAYKEFYPCNTQQLKERQKQVVDTTLSKMMKRGL